MNDTSVSLAHHYASEAEASEERYQWEQAIELHLKAAENFLLAVHDTHSPEVVQTLKLMHDNHTRQAKDLRRRLAKVQAASAAAARSSPKETGSNGPITSNNSYGSSPVRASVTTTPSSNARSADDSRDHPHHHHDRKGRHPLKQQQKATPGQSTATADGRGTSGSAEKARTKRGGHGANGESSDDDNGLHGHHAGARTHHHGMESRQSSHETSITGSGLGSSNASSTSSSATIEDSFTLIRNLRDDSDPFNKFWEAVENLVQKISSPVAFATIPLDVEESPDGAATQVNQQQQRQQPSRPSSFSSSQVQTAAQPWDDTPFAVTADAPKQPSNADAVKGPQREPPSAPPQHRKLEHLVSPHQTIPTAASHHRDDFEADMADSYYIIDSPSALTKHPTFRGRADSTSTLTNVTRTGENPPRGKKSIEEYEIENQQLKLALDRLSKRNLKLERSAQAAMQLKTNMNTWKQEVERRAMQLKQSQDMLRSVTMGRHANQIRSADSSALLLKRPQEVHSQTLPTAESEQPHVGYPGQPGIGTASVTPTTEGAEETGSGIENEKDNINNSSTQPTAYELANPMTIQQRLMELTAELEALKLENARQTALMRKYKQRWEDLKEAAKRRRSGVKVEEMPGAPTSSNNASRAFYEENLSNQQYQQQVSSGRQNLSPIGSPFPNTVVAGSSTSPSITRNAQNPGGIMPTPRPPAGLARSASASGPNLHPSGTYQRRIIMETNKGGLSINKFRNNHAPLIPSTAPGHGHSPSKYATATTTASSTSASNNNAGASA